MPKARSAQNRGLPSRWVLHHGAYYYHVPAGLESRWDGKKKFRLGDSLPEAYRTWAARLENIDAAETVAQLLDRYALEVVPTKGPKQQLDDNRYVRRLRSVFGELLLTDMRPQLIYQFIDKSPKKDQYVMAKRSAKCCTIGRSEMKPINKKKLGRPRKTGFDLSGLMPI